MHTVKALNYQKAIYLQLLLFNFFIDTKYPIMNFLNKDFCSLSREFNESLLSILDSNSSIEFLVNHDYVKEKYLNLQNFLNISNSLQRKDKKQKQNISIQDNHTQIIEVFLDILGKVTTNSFTYKQQPKKWSVYYLNITYDIINLKIPYNYINLKSKIQKTVVSTYNMFENEEDDIISVEDSDECEFEVVIDLYETSLEIF